MADLLEMCQFKIFWQQVHNQGDLIKSVNAFVFHVIYMTYQTTEEQVLGLVQGTCVAYWLEQYGWKYDGEGMVTVSSQEEIINKEYGLCFSSFVYNVKAFFTSSFWDQSNYMKLG